MIFADRWWKKEILKKYNKLDNLELDYLNEQLTNHEEDIFFNDKDKKEIVFFGVYNFPYWDFLYLEESLIMERLNDFVEGEKYD